MTDNAFSYTQNRSPRQVVRARQIQRLRTRPYTPRTDGKGERYQQTLQRGWAYALEYASSETRRASVPRWVNHYNETRTHSGLGNRATRRPRRHLLMATAGSATARRTKAATPTSSSLSRSHAS